MKLRITLSNNEHIELNGNWVNFKSTVKDIFNERFIVDPTINRAISTNQIIDIEEVL